MNSKSSHPVILLREVDPGEWWMKMPRITCEVDDDLADGINWMNSGDFDKASIVFGRLIMDLPEHLDAYHHLALAQQRSGKRKEAAGIWRAAVDLALEFFPERFDFTRHRLPWGQLDNRPFLRTYHGLAFCLLEDGAVEAALEIFERLLQLNPNDNQGARSMAVDCYLELKQPKGVLKVCRQYPHDGIEHLVYGRALALFQLGRVKQATTALQRAIGLQPLIAKELLKKQHRRPPGTDDRYVTMGGTDQAFLYWKGQGKHWQNTPGALEWLKGVLTQSPPGD